MQGNAAAGSSAGSTADPSADRSVGDAGPSAEPSTVPTTTILDPTVPTTVSLFERLFVKDKTSLSPVILDAIRKLQYTPGREFRRKGQNKDLSGLLGPVGIFTDTFLRVLDNMVLSPKASRNLVSVRINMKKQMPVIVADPRLAPFFAAWGINVINASKSPSPRPDDVEERQVQMALQASTASAAAEAARREAEDADDESRDADAATAAQAEAEESLRAILQELDIVNSALMHRLARWSRRFPKPKPEDLMWPNSFNKDERKQISSFVRRYIEDHDMWLKELDTGEQTEAIEEMKDHADFPLDHARNSAVIQLCFISLRKDRRRYSQTPDSRETSIAGSSRGPSPVKSNATSSRGPSPVKSNATSSRGPSPAKSNATSSRDPSPVKPSVESASGGSAGKGKRKGKRKAGDDVDEDEEGAGPVRPKRARAGTRLRQSYTLQDLEEDNDGDDYEVEGEEDELLFDD
jgi:hypothetical protein